MNIKYTLSFPEPHIHYTEVEMHITGISANELQLKMAVWTPGSYLIREFAKNIDFVEWSIDNSKWIRAEKINKNTWKITLRNDASNASDTCNVSIRYRTYCFDYSVRTNFVDESHALINGAPTFLYIAGFEQTPVELHIQPYPAWLNISTSLAMKENDKWVRTAEDIHELIDSPIEIGNHASYFFDAANVPHELAIYGQSNCDVEKLIADLKAIIQEETKIFGAHPCKNYVFIIHNTDSSYGGLEHLHSSVNHITRWSYEPKKYQQAISLLAHEYFHLWNVKRIRPVTLGPFDYETENYTTLLWFFEGVTSYYDDYVCYRAGVTSEADYFEVVAKNINGVLNTPGIDTQTLSEASFDTWLKYYRRNENSNNSQVNYYTKGAVVAMLFDFIILDSTNGEKNLDDVMRKLYENYVSSPAIGITEEDLLSIFNAVSGIDFSPYFQRYIHSTESISIETYFALLGIVLKDTNDATNFHLGLSTIWKDGKLMVTETDKRYGAYKGGLNVHDEIIAIDGFRVMQDFTKIYAHKKAGDIINVNIARQGVLNTLTLTLTPDSRKNYILIFAENILDNQFVLLKKWLQ